MIPVPAILEELAPLGLQAVLNGLWQGLLLTAAVAAGLRLLPRTGAATRHLVWLATLLVVVALPAAALLRSQPAPAAAPALAMVQPEAAAGVPAELSGPAAAQPSAAPAAPASSETSGWRIEVPSGGWMGLLLGFGLLVGMARAGRVVYALGSLRRLKQASRPLPPQHRAALERVRDEHLGRAVELRVSERIGTPVTLGYLHPAILFPVRLLEELRQEELRQITLHELAHVRRGDAWTNLAQRLIEAVFFFHPAVHWIGRRIELERELACDDYVVAHSAGERAYARCLTRLAELTLASRYARLAPGAAARGGQLTHRVRALLAADRARRGGTSVAAASGLVAGIAVFGLALVHAAPALDVRVRELRPGDRDRPLAAPSDGLAARPAEPETVPAPTPMVIAPSAIHGAPGTSSRAEPQGALTGSGSRDEPLAEVPLPAPLAEVADRPVAARLACSADPVMSDCAAVAEEHPAVREQVLAGADADPASEGEEAESAGSSRQPPGARSGGRGVNIGIAVAVPLLPRSRPARGRAWPSPSGRPPQPAAVPPQPTGLTSPTMNLVEAIRGERVEVTGGIRLRIGGGSPARSPALGTLPW